MSILQAFKEVVKSSGDLDKLIAMDPKEFATTKEEFEQSRKLDEDGDDLMEENNELDLRESLEQDCEDLNEE